MSNFFPNKAADLVMVDMINAQFQSNAQRSDFVFGTPIVNDNPFVNTVMSVNVVAGPLFGRLTEVYYNRLNFAQLLTPRNISLPEGSYANVSDLLPLIKQNYNIDIRTTDIIDSTIELATTDETPSAKTIRLAASGPSIAFYGVGDVQIQVTTTVSTWMSFINIDEDFASTLFPTWENGYAMTGFKVSVVEQGVPFSREYFLGLGLNYNGSYLIADFDNTFELTVATAESWAFDAIARTADNLPIHGNLDDFPFIPFIKIILLNPMNGFENIQPLKFIHVPDLNRTGLRTWRVAGQSFIPPAYEYNQDGVYVSRTRIVDESYQAPTDFASVMSYFNAAIGDNGTHFNQSNFEIQIGLENTSGVVQSYQSTYVNVKHFLDQPATWGVTWTSTVNISSGNRWQTSLPFANSVGDMVFINGSGLGAQVCTADGVNWRPWRGVGQQAIAGARWVAEGNGVFITIGDYDGVSGYRIWRSTDAVNWTEVAVLPITPSACKNICWTGINFVIVSPYTVDKPVIYTSPDGLTWTPRTYTSPGFVGWNSVCVVSDGFGAVVAMNKRDRRLISVDDGLTWTFFDQGSDGETVTAGCWTGNAILFVDGFSAYRSTDNGNTFLTSAVELGGCYSLVSTPQGVLANVESNFSNARVALSADDGATWSFEDVESGNGWQAYSVAYLPVENIRFCFTRSTASGSPAVFYSKPSNGNTVQTMEYPAVV